MRPHAGALRGGRTLTHATPPTPTRGKTWVAALGAFLAAFVAGSHHSLHMLLLSVGLGGSSLLFSPGVRRAMLLVSLAMTLVSAWSLLRRPRRSGVETLAVSAALGASLVLLVGSVIRDGW